ncbi:VOC family protein [Daejeonella lutea]|nr:VOC family protein [Daejeonella lutea]
METLDFPKNHQRLMPYLVMKDADRFIRFMQDVFGAKEKMNYKPDGKIIAHAELSIGESVIMFSGDTTQLEPCTIGGFIYVADADETYKKAIDSGAIGVMPIKESPFGRSGGFTDPFGNTWWVKAYRSTE